MEEEIEIQEKPKEDDDDDDRKSAIGQNQTTTTSTVRGNTFGHRGPGHNLNNALRGRSGGPGGLSGPLMQGGGHGGGLGYLYVLVFMFVAIAGATVMTGGAAPRDPNGPGGPPTLPPYFSTEGQEPQELIFPTSITPNPKEQLQLKTFLINTCSQTVAIDFLLDVSGSMEWDGKMGKMQSALQSFTSKLGGSSAIAMQTFSATTEDKVTFDYYRNNKAAVNMTIASLRPRGYTSTKDGMTMAKEKLSAAITAKKFPGYKYYLILMTDGIPETPNGKECLVTAVDDDDGDERCFAKAQDPRGPPDISKEIKDLDVTIYSIGIYSQRGSDKELEPHLEKMLKHVATSPEHYFSSPNATNLSSVLGSILKSICVPITEEKTVEVAPTK